jgi:hypothetical protein
MNFRASHQTLTELFLRILGKSKSISIFDIFAQVLLEGYLTSVAYDKLYVSWVSDANILSEERQGVIEQGEN